MTREHFTAAVGFVFVITVMLIVPAFLYARVDRGTFGDMFGVANALFSGLAFCGIIYTLLLQKQSIDAQKAEILHAKQQMTASMALQAETVETIKKQADYSIKTFELQTLSAALETTLKQLHENHSSAEKSTENSQKIIKLNERKKTIESRIEAITNNVIDHKK